MIIVTKESSLNTYLKEILQRVRALLYQKFTIH